MATRRNGSDVMERILDAATEVFATEGLAGARVDGIAARAGISKALIYYHIDDKESLYGMVMRRMLETARAALAEATSGAETPEERLRLAIREVAELAERNRHFAPLMLREIATGGAGLADGIMDEMRKVFGVIAETLTEGIEQGVFRPVDPYATHMLVAGGVLVLMAGAPIRRRVRRGSGAETVGPAAVPDYVTSLLLDGIRSPAPAPKRPPKKK